MATGPQLQLMRNNTPTEQTTEQSALGLESPTDEQNPELGTGTRTSSHDATTPRWSKSQNTARDPKDRLTNGNASLATGPQLQVVKHNTPAEQITEHLPSGTRQATDKLKPRAWRLDRNFES